MVIKLIAILAVAGWVIGWMFSTWILFLAVMKLQDVRDTVGFTKWNQSFAFVILFIGLVYDAVLNLIMTVIMLDIPQFTNTDEPEWLLSPHVKRVTHSTGNSIRERWARGWARWVCKNFLVPVDRKHCG